VRHEVVRCRAGAHLLPRRWVPVLRRSAARCIAPGTRLRLGSDSNVKQPLQVTSARLRGELGAQRRVRGTHRALGVRGGSPSRRPSPRIRLRPKAGFGGQARGAREKTYIRSLATRNARAVARIGLSRLQRKPKLRRSLLSDRLELRLLRLAQRRIELPERGAHQIDRLLRGTEPPVHGVKANR